MHSIRFHSYLDAVFKSVPWQREAFFLIDWLTENDQLLKQEDPPLPRPGHEATFLLTDREGVLLEQLPLSCDFTLKQCVRVTNIVRDRKTPWMCVQPLI